MSEGGQGRARGRGGRGRSRALQSEPPAPGQAPPPSQPQGPQPGAAGAAPSAVGRGRARGVAARAAAQQQQQQFSQQPQQQAEDMTGGRGMQRGGGRERPSGNGNGDPPTAQMERMKLGDRGDAPYQRRAPYEKYVERTWKSADAVSKGTKGDRCTLITNYFPVTLPSEFQIYQYHVDFKPAVENIRVKFAMIAGLSDVVGETKCFDGGILYLTRKLPNDPSIHYAKRGYDGQQVQITFTCTCEVMPTSPQFLQIANLLFKRVQGALKMKQIRDHYFNMGLSVQVKQHRLEVVPGFTTSILKYEGGNLLGVDIIHKILRMDTMLDALYDLYHSMNADVNTFHAQAIKNFVGNIVMTRFNNKTYRVDDIDWNARPSDTFDRKGEAVSYVQYYKEHWNVNITDLDQPLLVTKPTDKDVRRGDKENLYLVPELCTITGLSEQAKSDFNVMRDLAVHTRIGPDKRVATLERFLGQINSDQEAQKVLSPWQMSIAPRAARIPARQYPAETLVMRQSRGRELHKMTYNIREADWSRNMRNAHLLNPVHMTNWLIVFPNRAKANAAELSDCLHRVGQGMGMNISQPLTVELANDRNDTYLQAIRSNLNDQVQMVVCVCMNNKKDRYDAIKKSCCIDNPVPSQVVLTKTLSKKQGLMSVATKIAIQMNCKMGGEVWGIEIPMGGFMVVGMDSYHDSANKNQSVGALVASLNKECTRYYSKTEYHPSKDDLMRNLSVLFSGALRKYHDVNSGLPQKIFIYRDGVGDGQLPVVYHSEMDQIRQACKEAAGESYNPKISFIVVKKRISTRLFAQENNQITNPQPGTIVDEFVTKSEWYDFFLVSQSVRQGTVTPTSFNVIYDDTGLQPDHIQRLTYKMTHMYFNWQGTVRVPAPCQYAHKLAFLQGQSLHREFSAHLADKLFYL